MGAGHLRANKEYHRGVDDHRRHGQRLQHDEPPTNRLGPLPGRPLIQIAHLPGVRADLSHVVNECQQRRQRARRREQREVSELYHHLAEVAECALRGLQPRKFREGNVLRVRLPIPLAALAPLEHRLAVFQQLHTVGLAGEDDEDLDLQRAHAALVALHRPLPHLLVFVVANARGYVVSGAHGFAERQVGPRQDLQVLEISDVEKNKIVVDEGESEDLRDQGALVLLLKSVVVKVIQDNGQLPEEETEGLQDDEIEYGRHAHPEVLCREFLPCELRHRSLAAVVG